MVKRCQYQLLESTTPHTINNNHLFTIVTFHSSGDGVGVGSLGGTGVGSLYHKRNDFLSIRKLCEGPST